MIFFHDFIRAYQTIKPGPDPAQTDIILESPNSPQYIVAGPGSGKTTVLTLRILKLILVDKIPPTGILATTFTKKAAAELRSRILGWGYKIIETLKNDSGINEEQKKWLSNLDINQVITGTIDSISELLVREYRLPGMPPPVLADEFVAKTLMLTEGIFSNNLHNDDEIHQFLVGLVSSTYGFNLGKKNDLIYQIWERRFQDLLNWGQLTESLEVLQKVNLAHQSFQEALEERNLMDFSMLEKRVLELLREGHLTEFTNRLKVVLVDEYQDSNLQQEAIYFELAKATNGVITVVGDEDQSLYRFRGATVDLFSNFADRYWSTFEREIEPQFLQKNYRSSQNIVQFVNSFAELDVEYQTVRVADKPRLEPNHSEGVPILALFRNTLNEISDDLSDFLFQIFRGDGFQLSNGQIIRSNLDRGDLGDCAILCSSPAETKFNGDHRLPGQLRARLLDYGIELFNPRGEDLVNIPEIRILAGLILECIDPNGDVTQENSRLLRDVIPVFDTWRRSADNLFDSDEVTDELRNYVYGWFDRNPGKEGYRWPRSTSVIELLYGLNHFFPVFHNNPEFQVYLEVFTRQLVACTEVSPFDGNLIYDPQNDSLSKASIKYLLQYFLAPIASGTVKVNEDIIPAFPRNKISIMSIHQSKGLEFPLVIVDVGSEFRTNHHTQAFKRFPRRGETPHLMEDFFRPYSPLGSPTRTSIDRAFDDLYRQFFVAYSRPQNILLLTGLNGNLPGGNIQNVATGYNRSGINHWQGNLPFLEI